MKGGDNMTDDIKTLELVCEKLEKELLQSDEELQELRRLIDESEKSVEELYSNYLKWKEYKRKYPKEEP